MALTIGGFYIQQANISGGDSVCVSHNGTSLMAYLKGLFQVITNVEIEYIKG